MQILRTPFEELSRQALHRPLTLKETITLLSTYWAAKNRIACLEAELAQAELRALTLARSSSSDT